MCHELRSLWHWQPLACSHPLVGAKRLPSGAHQEVCGQFEALESLLQWLEQTSSLHKVLQQHCTEQRILCRERLIAC